eukprot:7663315-Alexandrium_andersonii.AAC.1
MGGVLLGNVSVPAAELAGLEAVWRLILCFVHVEPACWMEVCHCLPAGRAQTRGVASHGLVA